MLLVLLPAAALAQPSKAADVTTMATDDCARARQAGKTCVLSIDDERRPRGPRGVGRRDRDHRARVRAGREPDPAPPRLHPRDPADRRRHRLGQRVYWRCDAPLPDRAVPARAGPDRGVHRAAQRRRAARSASARRSASTRPAARCRSTRRSASPRARRSSTTSPTTARRCSATSTACTSSTSCAAVLECK